MLDRKTIPPEVAYRQAKSFHRNLARDRIGLAKLVAQRLNCHFMEVLVDMGEKHTNPAKKLAKELRVMLTEEKYGRGCLDRPF